MWKLPNGSITRFPRDLTVANVNYSKKIFSRWSIAELNAIGVYPFTENRFDDRYYRSTGFTDTETDGSIVRTHTSEARISLNDLKKEFAGTMRDMGRQTIKRVQDELFYLNNFEPGAPELAEWATYRSDYKSAFQTIKAAVVAITEFEDMIKYIQSGWQDLIPVMPGEDII